MSRNDEIRLNNIDPDINLNLNIDACRYYTIDQFNLDFSSDTGKYFLLNQNIQSFSAKQAVFEAFLASLNVPLHTLVLSETWNEPKNLQLCKIENFRGIHTHRTIRRSQHGGIGGGVSIFANSSIYNIKKINQLSICNESIETCVARISRKDHPEKEHIIIGIYRPRHDDDPNFLLALEGVISSQLLHNKTLIIAGDINIDLLKCNDNYVNQYLSVLYSLNFIQVINKATRFPNGSHSTYNPSCLDHIFINKFTQYTGPVFFVDISDHCGSALYFDFHNNAHITDSKHKITFRLINEQNLSTFEDKITQTDWNFLLTISDINEQFSTFQNYINATYCDCFPIKTKLISDGRNSKPWITTATLAKIKLKSMYFKQYRDGLITREENNRLKNRLNKEINHDKKLYYLNLFANSKNNMKKSWKELHSLLGTNNRENSVENIFNNANSDQEKLNIVNKFNDFFTNIGSTLASQMPVSTNSAIFPTDYIHQNFYVFPPTYEEISKIIRHLKVTRTSINVLPVNLFKKFCNTLAVPVTLLIENSIQNGVFPDDLKIARITPIHKEDSYTEPSNFRPISSLCYLSKVYEKFFSLRLLKFCNKYSVISPKQFGFQSGISTTDALLRLTEDIYSALDNHLHFFAAIIDIKKAFDCVNHDILKIKLERYGVRGTPLKWLESYLKDRKCYVELGSHTSRINTFNIGVPQGSILGPTLFLIYINNLPKISETLQTQLFADDTIVSNIGSNIDALTCSTNEELIKLNDWTVANRLTIHAGKTKFLTITNRPIMRQNLSIKILDSVVRPINSAKYLGVFVDDKLTFKTHIDYVISKISRHTGILYKIRDNLPTKTRLDYYYAYIYPYLSYCTIIWGCAYQTHLNPLFIQQKRTIRTIVNAGFRDHTDPHFKALKLLKVQDIYKFQLGCHMFHARARGDYATQSNIRTRMSTSNSARAVFHNYTTTQHAVSYAGPTFWNDLPPYLRSIDSYRRFRKCLKEYLINEYND